MNRKAEIQAFNDGVLSVHGIARHDDGSDTLSLKHASLRFSERTVGFSRYYAAMQENVKVEMVVRVPRHDDISTQDVVIINGLQYEIAQVQHPKGAYPPCCDLSLMRVAHDYDTDRI